ncbi:DUF975 family protein [Alkalihalobacillus sp. BA299]|uniref:DUF975 family protein n=1 Tax=Alkalihalobacillus sp. BA299 TaxID=2815938 RepID=UPI001ADB20CA|nr:DUF975 family protein [Alkalihalobacillus sp. BA299]
MNNNKDVVDLIYHIKYKEGNKFLKAFLYSFKNKSLLFKGFVILALSRLLQFFIVILLTITFLYFLIFLTGDVATPDIAKFIGLLVFSLIIVWIYLGLSQSMYILYERPKIKLFKCIYYSFKLMRGNRASLIGLYLIFGLWFLLGLVALVVGVLWILAFFEVSRVEFYQSLKLNNEGFITE